MVMRAGRIMAAGLAVALSGTAAGAADPAAGPLTGLVKLFSPFEGRDYTTVYFDFDRDLLDDDARARLRRKADYISGNPDILFAVTGHTDLVGNPVYNKDLGLRRALRVVAHLTSLGVNPAQLRAMVSAGESDPAVDTEDRERLNRRVVTTVMGPMQSASPATGLSAAGAVSPAPVTDGGSPDIVLAETSDPATAPDPVPSPDPTLTDTTAGKPRPGNSAYGTGKPDAGGGNGDEPSGDPAGSIGHNRGGDEPVN